MTRPRTRLFTPAEIVGFVILAVIIFAVLPLMLDSFRLNLFGK